MTEVRCLLVFVLLDLSEANDNVQVHSRAKRFLSFRNVTHFFVRLNFKATTLEWTQIVAQAFGFRINWDDPPDSFHPYHHLQRRSLYSNLELLMDKNGFNGFHCIRRAICETRGFDQPAEIYHKILKIVFSQKSPSTDKWHNVSAEECQTSLGLCPLSTLDVSLFTDL
ncbi:DM4/DM12 family domain-containing protein [Phthorimaea operculella]|nr:DM4/DM12 family domain-containing protein [Phthorimaea operculella]